jgi:Sec7-like guanine-nucleotide exchange factor
MLSYSVLILSNDLHNPRIKNKMTKREFIRNTRQLPHVDDDYSGHLYDNIWVLGHVLGTVLDGPEPALPFA